MRYVAITLILVSAALAHAAHDCEERLSARVHSLMKVLNAGLENNVLSRAAAEAFVNSKEWNNPFAESSSQLLGPTFRRAFELSVAKFQEDDRVKLKQALANELKRMQGDTLVAAQAKADTRRVFAPTFVTELEVGRELMSPIYQIRVDGRPVFLRRVSSSSYSHDSLMIFDPFNPDGPQQQVKVQGVDFSKVTKLDYLPPARLSVRRNTEATATVIDDTVIVSDGKTEIPLHLERYGLASVLELIVFKKDDRLFVAIAYDSSPYGSTKIVVLDVHTGQEQAKFNGKTRFSWMKLAWAGKNPAIYAAMAGTSLTDDLVILDGFNGTSREVKIGKISLTNIDSLHLEENNYLYWFDYQSRLGQLVFHNVETGQNTYVQGPLDGIAESYPFEYAGDTYLLLVGHAKHSYLYKVSQRPSVSP